MKAIFLIEIHDTAEIRFAHKSIFDNYGIGYEYWDLRHFLGHENVRPVHNPFPDVPIRTFHRKEELEQALAEESNCVFITGYTLQKWNRFFYKLLRKYHHRYIALCTGMNYMSVIEPVYAMFNIRNGFFNSTVYYLYSKLLKRFNAIDPTIARPEYTFLGNKYDTWKYNFPAPKKELVFAHTLDYERLEPFIGKQKDTGLIVFVDQYLPYNNETRMFKWQMKDSVYYPKIRSFLLSLKEITGHRVVVATHPKAERGKIEQFMEGVEVAYGKTYELISDCSFAVIHHSAAVNLCVLQHKPFLFMLCNDLKSSPIYGITKRLAAKFNKNYLDIDRVQLSSRQELDTYLTIDAGRYARFMNDDIKKKGTPEKSYWEIIADKISLIGNQNP